MPDRELSVEQALAALRDVDDRLDSLGPEHPQRPALEARRVELEAAARRAADEGRDPDAIRAELEHLRKRLAGLDAELIRRSWAERGDYRWLNDPGAYAHGINREIAAANDDLHRRLVARITELEDVLRDRNPPPVR